MSFRSHLSLSSHRAPGPSQTYPKLPVEIVMHIFEHAAAMSPHSARVITLVAPWSVGIGRKELYSTVVIKSFKKLTKLYGKNSVPFEERGSLIRNLWIEETKDISLSMALFDSCRNLQSLAIQTRSLRSFLASNFHYAEDADGHPTSRRTPCRQFTLINFTFRYDWDQFTNKPHGQVFLANLTHVSVLDIAVSFYIPVSSMPSLTHLAVPICPQGRNSQIEYHAVREFYRQLLEHHPIVMLVILCDTSQISSIDFKKLGLSDKRLHLFARQYRNDVLVWEAGVRGHLSIWERAAVFAEIFKNASGSAA